MMLLTTSRNGERGDEVVGMVVGSSDTSTQRADSDMRLTYADVC
jgi:hypothetical protein